MKTGLLLVDIQNDYFTGGAMELVGMEVAAANAARLLAAFRDRGLPLWHVQHVMEQPDAPFFAVGGPGVEINEIVRPSPGEIVVQKHFPNSFRETGLLEKLRAAEVDRLVICGAMSHMCIDAATRAAADFGLACIVIHDACATRDLEHGGRKVPAEMVHGAFMAALASAYAAVTGVDEFLAGLA